MYMHVWQKFRENNVFAKKVSKELIWQIFLSFGDGKFFIFPHYVLKLLSIFSSNWWRNEKKSLAFLLKIHQID